MEIMWLLIPLSTVLVLLVIGVFGWALHRGQFEDLEDEGARILLEDAAPALTAAASLAGVPAPPSNSAAAAAARIQSPSAAAAAARVES
jgi:cbb3-type cytochrome oxidase maturation protein